MGLKQPAPLPHNACEVGFGHRLTACTSAPQFPGGRFQHHLNRLLSHSMGAYPSQDPNLIEPVRRDTGSIKTSSQLFYKNAAGSGSET